MHRSLVVVATLLLAQAARADGLTCTAVLRVGHLTQQLESIQSVSVSPDRRLIACAGNSRVFVWDTSAGFQTATLAGTDSTINPKSVAFSPDGRRLAVGGGDNRVVLWAVGTWEQVDTWGRHDGDVTCLAYSPDGRLLASGGEDGMIQVCEAATGRLVASLNAGNGQHPKSIAFSRDGKTFVSGGGRSTLVWETASWTPSGAVRDDGKDIGVACVDVSPDGRSVVLAWGGASVQVRDTATGRVLKSFDGHPAPVRAVAFTPDGESVVAACDGGSARVWDVAGGTVRHTLTGPESDPKCLKVSADGKWAVIAAWPTGIVGVWDLTTGKRIGLLPGAPGAYASVTVSPDGREITTLSRGATTWLRWRFGTGWVEEVGKDVNVAPGAQAYSRDGTRYAIAMANKKITVRDGRGAWSWLRGAATEVDVLAFSPDGSSLASGERYGALRVWDLDLLKEAAEVVRPRHRITSLAYSPQVGRGLLAATVKGHLPLRDGYAGEWVEVRDAKTLATVWQRPAPPTSSGFPAPSAVRYTPDGRFLVVLCDRFPSLQVWRAEDGKPVAIVPSESLEGYTGALAISADGGRVATSFRSSDGGRTPDRYLVALWQLDPTGPRPLQIAGYGEGHTSPIYSLDFSSDGKVLASASDDRTVRIWRVGPVR